MIVSIFQSVISEIFDVHEPQNPENVNLPAMKFENRFETRITASRASVMINLVLRSMFSIIRATLKIFFKKDQNRLVKHEFILDLPPSATQPTNVFSSQRKGPV